MKLSVKAYNSNATVFGDNKQLDICYSGDECMDFTFEENMEDIKEKIIDCFGDDIENMDEILLSFTLYVQNVSKRD